MRQISKWVVGGLLVCQVLVGCQVHFPENTPSGGSLSTLKANTSLVTPTEASLSHEDYVKLSAQTIVDDLQAGDPQSLNTFVEWGKSQPEYYPGSRNAIARQVQTLAHPKLNVSQQEQLTQLQTLPVKAVQQEAYKPVNFDTDQGNHPNKLAEWWYYTGHLKTSAGTPYGYELCFFRVAPVIYFAHVAVTDETHQKFTYERNFYRPSRVKLSRTRTDIRYDNQQSEQNDRFGFKINGTVGPFNFDLTMKNQKEPLMINGNGLIDMPEGLDSYYYSLTRLTTEGTLTINGKKEPVTGQSWMDHQWGHFYALRIGWDWFSFQMEDGSEYNLFGFRRRNGQRLKRYVNLINSRNQPIHGEEFKIDRLQWWKSPKTGRLYVTKWKVTVPQTQEVFEIEAVQPDQEVAATKIYDVAPTYWEGRCQITKIRADGTRVPGFGYTEHMSYAQQMGAD